MNAGYATAAASAAKWVGIAGLFAGAFYHATVTRRYDEAFQLLTAGFAGMGFALKLTHMTHNQEAVKEDLTNIRENPAMPGTPPGRGGPPACP